MQIDNLEEPINKILDKHSEFSKQDLIDYCKEYVSNMHSKTKDRNKRNILLKHLSKEFEVDLDISSKNKSKASIPKSFFETTSQNRTSNIVTIKNLTHRFGDTVVFDDASVNIKFGDKVALIGKNGAGKSTLLKMLVGKQPLDKGRIIRTGDINIGYLSQELMWEHSDMKVQKAIKTALPEITSKMLELQKIEKQMKENIKGNTKLAQKQSEIIDWMVRNDGYRKYDMQNNILNYFGFDEKQKQLKVKDLSGGEQIRFMIAKFLLQDVDMLVLDEPTNHLDVSGIMFLEEFCKSWNKTLVCITHDKRFINNVFDRIIELYKGKLTYYEGNYDDYVDQKQKEYELKMKRYKKQQKYLKKQRAFIKKFRYKASKASQVQSRIKQLEKLDKISEPRKVGRQKDINFQLNTRLPNTVIRLKNLEVGYDESLVSLEGELRVTKKMKIGIMGPNGVGKTTLINTILGQIDMLDGLVYIHNSIKIGSYGQIVQQLDGSQKIIDEIRGYNVSYQLGRKILGTLEMDDEKIRQKISSLSGGEKAKVALTKMLLQEPHVIVMDEPTNHLDIESKKTIKKMLANFDGVTIVVSHDRDLIESVSNRLRVVKNKTIKEYISLKKGFDYLME